MATGLAFCSAVASASPVLLGFSGGNSFASFNGTDMTVGWRFTVAAGDGVTVTDLGWYDQTPATPLGSDHQVGIWDSTGTLLGSVNVLTTGALHGSFRYGATSPFVLAGGSSYIIGGAISSPFADNYVSGTSSISIDPMFTFNGSTRSGSSQGFAAPLVFDGANGRFGPNFEFSPVSIQPVPEPPSLVIVLTALGLLGATRLRRKPPQA